MWQPRGGGADSREGWRWRRWRSVTATSSRNAGSLEGHGVVNYNHSVVFSGSSHPRRLWPDQRSASSAACRSAPRLPRTVPAGVSVPTRRWAEMSSTRRPSLPPPSPAPTASSSFTAETCSQNGTVMVVTLIKGQHLKESAKGAKPDALSVLRHCHWMVKVVVDVISRFRLTDEALSSMLADMAFSHGAAYIDVEALLSAGDASASGTGEAPGDRLAKVKVELNGPKFSVDWFRNDLVHLTDDGLLAIIQRSGNRKITGPRRRRRGSR